MCRCAQQHHHVSSGSLHHTQLPDPAEKQRRLTQHLPKLLTTVSIMYGCEAHTRLAMLRVNDSGAEHVYLHKVSLLVWKVKRTPTKL